MANSMILEIPIKGEKRDEFIGVMNAELPKTQAYDGCRHIEFWTPEEEPNLVMFYEVWESKEHQAKYFQWRIETGLMEALGPFLTGEPKVRWLDVHPIGA